MNSYSLYMAEFMYVKALHLCPSFVNVKTYVDIQCTLADMISVFRVFEVCLS